MSSITTIPNLEQIITPLLDRLNRQYPAGPQSEYLIPTLDPFEVLNPDHGGIAIELPDDIVSNELAARAIATLLQATGSEATWVCGRNPEDDQLERPLRFSLAKRSAWAGYFWAGSLYLVIDYLDDDLDVDAAARQVASLVAHLEDPDNLVALTPEDRALLF